MSIREHVTCDICGKEWEIQTVLDRPYLVLSLDLCRRCRDLLAEYAAKLMMDQARMKDGAQ